MPWTTSSVATALVSHSPADVPCWREYFWKVRRRFFGCALALVFSLALLTTAIGSVSLSHPIRLLQAMLVCLFMAGLVSEKQRVHVAVVGLAAASFTTLFSLTLAGLIDLDLRE